MAILRVVSVIVIASEALPPRPSLTEKVKEKEPTWVESGVKLKEPVWELRLALTGSGAAEKPRGVTVRVAPSYGEV